MSRQPEAYIDFEVYEDGKTLIGVGQVSLPEIAFMNTSITGAGVGGTVETPLAGMMEAMTMTMNFRSVTDAGVQLASPRKHNIDLRAVGQYWNTETVDKELWADKYVMVVFPKKLSPGTVAPASASDASGEYSVYYLAAYKNGQRRIEIDPFNQICYIDGVDHLADVRRALGKA